MNHLTQDKADSLRENGFYSLRNQHYEEARTKFEAALSEYHANGYVKDHPYFAECLFGLAKVFNAQNRLCEAEGNYLKALNIYKKRNRSTYVLARCYHDLAMFYQIQGHLKKAENNFLAALKIWESDFGKCHFDTIKCYYDLSRVYLAQRRLPKAQYFGFEALKIAEEFFGSQHPTTAEYHENLAKSLGNSLSAHHHSLRAVTVKLKNRLLAFSVSGSKNLQHEYTDIQSSLSLYYSLALSINNHVKEVAKDVFNVVLQSKYIQLDANILERREILISRHPEVKELFYKYQKVVDKIHATQLKKMETGAADRGRKLRHKLDSLAKELDQIEAEISDSIPEIKRKRLQRQATMDLITKQMPPDSTLVEYVKYQKVNSPNVNWCYFAIVLHQQTPNAVRLIDLGDADKIEDEINNFLDSLLQVKKKRFYTRMIGESVPDDADEYPPKTKSLHDLLIQKLGILSLTKKIQLFIAPDAELCKLPFGILQTSSESDNYLRDFFSIHYLNCARDIVNLPRSSKSLFQKALIVANPNFDKIPPKWKQGNADNSAQHQTVENAKTFKPLPGTGLEANVLKETMEKKLIETKLLEGNKATKNNIKRELRIHSSPSILHIASHGFYESQNALSPALKRQKSQFDGLRELENPLLRSGIALTGANISIKDGVLFASDIQIMDLLNTDLVVLSACESGRGDLNVTQGVIGLRSSLMVAGAKSLVVSLWEVNDLATCIFMEKFYTGLCDNLDKAQALTQASNHLRTLTVGDMRDRWLTNEMENRFENKNGNIITFLRGCPDDHTPFNAPTYWAAFILIGDPKPLTLQTFNIH